MFVFVFMEDSAPCRECFRGNGTLTGFSKEEEEEKHRENVWKLSVQFRKQATLDEFHQYVKHKHMDFLYAV